MDGFDLIFGVIALASVTSWLTIRNAKTISELASLKPELLAMTISWSVAIITAIYLLR